MCPFHATCAEELICTSSKLLSHKDELLICHGSDGPAEFTLVALSVRFSRMSPAFKLRAIVEEWSHSRIVTELSAHE